MASATPFIVSAARARAFAPPSSRTSRTWPGFAVISARFARTGSSAEFIFRLDFFDIIHISGQETVAAGDLQEFHAGYAFDEHADEASRHLEHLCHFDDSADVVKVVFLRYFHAGILLHGHDEVSFAFPCKAHGFDGFFSSDVQIDGHAGINDYISQRHYREVERLIFVLYFIHR
mgnify:CR=1 FL=1